MTRHRVGIFLLSNLYSLLSVVSASAQEPVRFVEPRIGTAPSCTLAAGQFGKGSEEHGQTIPAVLTPHGMNFWTPQTRATERKCVAPYYYADTLFQGFRASHWLNGGCTQDYGSFTIMPLWGTLRTSPQARATVFSHDDELSTPYLYAVPLPEQALTAEVTSTNRCGIARFVYGQPGKAYIVFQPNSDEALGSVAIDTLHRRVTLANPVHRIYQGKGQPAGFSGHMVAEPSRAFSGYGVFTADTVLPGRLSLSAGQGVGAYLEFDLDTPGDTLLVRSACSFVSPEGALRNLRAEMPDFDFDRVAAELRQTWNDELGRIEIETETTDSADPADNAALVNFYSALYRTAMLPRTLSDADGAFPPFANSSSTTSLPSLSSSPPATYYGDFSLWDTHRALHPLLVLLHPALSGEMMQSLVTKAQQGGWMPIFPCWNSYTAAMIGDHAASVIADAYAKGVRNFDAETAYRYLRKNAFCVADSAEYADGKGRRALPSYLRHGYIPLEDTVAHAYHRREQTSRTIEYAYDDFALAQLARALGHEADADTLLRRSLNYRRVINPLTAWADGRHADGEFLHGTDPFSFQSFITEGAPCHYTLAAAPHDPQGLIGLLGGSERFAARLDSLFSTGRYWHGNEPCHALAFMFNLAGRPDLTQRWTRHILETEYLPAPCGLSGNDDAGQMSAWYVFASLGLYPLCPSLPEYQITSPLFRRSTLRLDREGNTFTILAPALSPENIYIRRALLNGTPLPSLQISHDDIMRGGTLMLEMSNSKP